MIVPLCYKTLSHASIKYPFNEWLTSAFCFNCNSLLLLLTATNLASRSTACDGTSPGTSRHQRAGRLGRVARALRVLRRDERDYHGCQQAVVVYLTLIGKDAYNLLRDLVYPATLSSCNIPDLKTHLINHLRTTTFQSTERARFHNLARRSDETGRSFLLRLRQQAAKCGFADLETQMRDRIVAGIQDADLQKRLLRETSLTYKAAKQILESSDNVNQAVGGHGTGVLNTYTDQSNKRTGQQKFKASAPSFRKASRPPTSSTRPTPAPKTGSFAWSFLRLVWR